MAIVRVRFIADNSVVSASIRKLTGSLWSHVEFGTPSGTWIGAHLSGGIEERPSNYVVPTREYVYEIPCKDWQAKLLLAWATSKIGTKYGVKQIVGLMFQARSLRNPHRYICSQFCTEGLLMVFGAEQVLNVLDEWAYRITPETLHLSPIFTGRIVKKVG